MSVCTWAAWVIDDGRSPCRYLAFREGGFAWVDHPGEALHLCRRSDASSLLEPGWQARIDVFQVRTGEEPAKVG